MTKLVTSSAAKTNTVSVLNLFKWRKFILKTAIFALKTFNQVGLRHVDIDIYKSENRFGLFIQHRIF